MAEQNGSAQDVVLVGDIGGTNARLSLWKVQMGNNSATELAFKVYGTKDYPTFSECFRQFLKEEAEVHPPPHAVALAIAGAVVNNKCSMTNTNWVIDGDALQKEFAKELGQGRVALLNDFEAVGYGVLALEPSDLVTINDVPVLEHAPKVVMGPGTGLGAAQLFWDTGLHGYKVWPGEGAHATFAPRGWKQKALARYVTTLFGHCEIEQVACGSGLELIYQFLLSDEAANRPEVLKGKEHGVKKKAPEISEAALNNTDPVAVEAVDLMFAIVGAEAGAMALRCLAKGGVYIAGGITPKLLPRVAAGSLLEGFVMRKGREPFHKILQETPLFVITNEKVGQMGAVHFAKSLLKNRPPQSLPPTTTTTAA